MENIRVAEEITAISEDVTFLEYCRSEVCGILKKTTLEDIDYYKFYIFLHFYLEISLSSFFRMLVNFHVYINTPSKNLSREKMDKMPIQDKISTLIYFTTQNNIDILIDYYNNFAEKRNKITHGHSISATYKNGNIKNSDIVNWKNIKTMNQQLDFYNNIIDLVKGVVGILPSIKDAEKEATRKRFFIFSKKM